MSGSRKILANIIAALVIAVLIAVVLIPWDKVLNPAAEPKSLTKEQILGRQQWEISYAFGDNSDFYGSISFTDGVDEDGDPYCIGVLDEKTDALVVKLVDAYNADPKTIKPLAIEEARYSLTDGIVKACSYEMRNGSFMAFLGWCKQPVNLVYKEQETYGDGTVHYAGEKAATGGLTNYDYIKHKDDYSNYQFNPNPRTP
ncbi:MAG: hypothetical protein LBH87_03610 [Coriobacteriales bacterium]|jgi:hypothetical protein|nr:hypothetical protein [Coriobacteriales bacterium]